MLSVHQSRPQSSHQARGQSPVSAPVPVAMATPRIHAPVDAGMPLPVTVSVVHGDSPRRAALEDFIADVFKHRYGATLRHFLPEFLTLGQVHTIDAVLGLRRGSDASPFFLEQYFDQPAEALLCARLHRPEPRAHLVEIGNLVSRGGGHSQMLFVALTSLLSQTGARWAIFTATPEVRKLLSRLGLPQIVLGQADPARLAGGAGDWGSYYDGHPEVVAINVRRARRVLKSGPLNRLRLINCEPQLRQQLAGQRDAA